jgi:predicted Zn-dependent protease with MMP-like domain
VEQVLEELPPHLRDLLEEVPLIVEDYPSDKLLDELAEDDEEYDLQGLHTGIPLTHRSVEHSGVLPETITIFRRGILDEATDDRGRLDRDELLRQIRITILHEMGHHFGLEEDELRKLGYE